MFIEAVRQSCELCDHERFVSVTFSSLFCQAKLDSDHDVEKKDGRRFGDCRSEIAKFDRALRDIEVQGL